MLARIGLGDDDDAFFIRLSHQCPVDAGEALLLDFSRHTGGDLLASARTKIEGEDFGRPGAKALGHIVAGDDEVFAGLILAAHDDMAVRMAGVEMIDCHPVEFRAQVFLGLFHQAADHGLQVIILRAVLRCDDEAELVAVAG